MSPTHTSVKSLSQKIFTTFLYFTLAVIVVVSTALTIIYYGSYEKDAERDLEQAAQEAVETLETRPSTSRASTLQAQFSGLRRYTLIDADGAVLYDSAADVSTMGNHADRPEVKAARETGEAVSARYSLTLGTDTMYAAVALDDGEVLRIAETRHSLFAFLSGMLLPMLVALAVAAALAYAISRALTRGIMKPIDALNFDDLLENEIYEEMDPLLIRIDEQQRRLLQQNRELAEAESMRRDFSSNVSHEMKTPLQVISGYAELMKNGMVNPEDQQRFSELIYSEAQSMRSLINDVLTLSRLDEAALGSEVGERIDLHQLAQQVIARLGSLASQHGVELRLSGSSAWVEGNRTLLEEMVYNLTENGIRYNHEQGTVSVTVFSEEKPFFEGGVPEDEAGDAAPLADVTTVVKIRDTGMGVPDDMREKIFERFFRLDKSRSKETGGTGLGLAIVKHAVIYHDGSIAVEGKPGQGTMFTVRLPGVR